MKARKMGSPEPKVTVLEMAVSPLPLVVGAARTCYAEDLVFPDGVVGWEGSERLAASTFQSGHHTLLQHLYINFALEGVSRQVIWSLLHSHPFYNSSQQSQRYVSMGGAGFVIPPLEGQALNVYQQCLALQLEAYRRLVELLRAPTEAAYRERFPQVKSSQVGKKAQEIARYVLPVATRANLYYTINLLTLLRLNRLCLQPDNPLEQRMLVEKMAAEVLSKAPDLEIFFQEPLPEKQIPEWQILSQFAGDGQFREEFDASLGDFASELVSYQLGAEALLADAVREEFGISSARLGDDGALGFVLDPEKNPYLGETLNLSTVSKLMRALWHIFYAFRKRISHTADSQDQRHRTVPGSRPCLISAFSLEPDYITPVLVKESEEALALYQETMERTWEAISELLALGVGREFVVYLLPNATALRFTESGRLLHLLHKYRMRLCFSAQREIWRTAVEEVEQIRRVHSRIGKWLAPPCVCRSLSGVSPSCPEGTRFCGVKVWEIPMEEWERII